MLSVDSVVITCIYTSEPCFRGQLGPSDLRIAMHLPAFMTRNCQCCVKLRLRAGSSFALPLLCYTSQGKDFFLFIDCYSGPAGMLSRPAMKRMSVVMVWVQECEVSNGS